MSRALLNLRILIGTCRFNLGILIGTCLLKSVPLVLELTTMCVLCLKKNLNAPCCVILCLDCRRIALIGRCLVNFFFLNGTCLLLNLRILIGTCLLNLGILIGTCLLKSVQLVFELTTMYCKEHWKWPLCYHIVEYNGMIGYVFRDNVSCLGEKTGE